MSDDDFAVRLVIRPSEDVWDNKDDRWRAELADLRRHLTRDLAEFVEPPRPDPTKKGVELAEVVVTMGSAGVFTAMVESLKAWFGRRPKNSVIEVKIKHGAVEERTVRVDGANIDGTVLGDVAKTALNE